MQLFPLHPDALCSSMAHAIPTHHPNDTNSDVSASYEAVALLVHACFKNLGFKLLGFDEDNLDEAHTDELAPHLDSKWNDIFGHVTFVYRNPSTTQIHTIRVDRMGSQVEVRATAPDSDRILRISRPIRDIVNASALPIRISTNDDSPESRSMLVDRLKDVIKPYPTMFCFVSALSTEIIQHLGGVGNLGKQAEDGRDAAETAQREMREQQPLPPALESRQGRHNQPQPDAAAPPDPFGAASRPTPSGDFQPPGFEDPYDLNRGPGVGGVPVGGLPGGLSGGQNPFSIGGDDLYPAGLEPGAGLWPFLGPGNMGPNPSGGGMHPTFNDPLFGRRQDGKNPSHPPGARWDPLGPPGPRFGGPGGGSGGFSGFGGDII